MLNVVLVEPEIPANTGNIGRTCVLAGARLHLVGPLGFSLSEKALRRAGLAYWQSLDVRTYESWDDFVDKNPVVREDLSNWGYADAGRPGASADARSAGTGACAGGAPAIRTPRVHLLTKAGARVYTESTYHDGDYLVFGKESSGLARELIDAHPGLCERIPMRGDAALTNAEGWHKSHGALHPELKQDVCGNFVDPREFQVASLNLSNAAAIVLYEALRQTGFAGL